MPYSALDKVVLKNVYFIFLQLKLEDYKDRLKKGEALNQDQLVSARPPQNLQPCQKGRLLKEVVVFHRSSVCILAVVFFTKPSG